MTETEPETPIARTPGDMRRRTIDSRELFRGETEIQIVHDDAIYRMKITRQGKLILNK